MLYPGACVDLANGTWAAKPYAVADSLNSYAAYTQGPYTILDQSFKERLWHVVDEATPAGQRPAILSGSRSIWCGKYDANWIARVGYPNRDYQILYLDTGGHGADYTLSFLHSFSAELAYDYLHLIGGGGYALDPIGNSKVILDDIIASGALGNQRHLVSWTGSIQAGGGFDTRQSPVLVEGSQLIMPATASTSLIIEAQHRALYFVFFSDCLFSAEDGLWWESQGQVIDLVGTSDHGVIFGDQLSAGATDAFGGAVLVGTSAAPVLSARVPPGVGELWQLYEGSSAPTADVCTPRKALSSDHFFFGGDPTTLLTIPGAFSSIVGCALPVPPGTASVLATWSIYLDAPLESNIAASTEFRTFRGGAWSIWNNTSSAFSVRAGVVQAWITDGDELASAAQAESVQVRYSQVCGGVCQPASTGILYDDFRLEVVSGVPAPVFGLWVTDVAQTTFVDGTMRGTNCTTIPCWPGPNGTESGPPFAINGNFNSPAGPGVRVKLASAFRKNGMGINWHVGFGRDGVAHTNGAFNPAYDAPRMIYRLFDPATRTWSPFDSTELDAFPIQFSGTDTLVTPINDFSVFEASWPPRDKVEAGASLPGGFSIGGFPYGAPTRTSYSGLAYLPRGTRMQYYFKATDIGGGVTYQFSADAMAWEVEDLPTLPCSSIKAPDIIEFNVLPRVYPSGAAGTLTAGRTDTPVLNLDGAYLKWSYGQDPVTQALRGLGVRADRYRLLAVGGLGNIGGDDPDDGLFPSASDYGIKDSLATWYRIIIQSSHLRIPPVIGDQDAAVIRGWWAAPTGTDGGDRCLFGSGDDFFSAMMLTGEVGGHPNQILLAQEAFGVQSVTPAWNGAATVRYPVIDDRFSAPTAGPGLASPGTFTYPLDGGCLPQTGAPETLTKLFATSRNGRFDALTKRIGSEAAIAATYPMVGGYTNTAGIAHMTEKDNIPDHDRNKALSYGFSIQFARQAGITAGASNYARSGVENRMRVLYKFLTSCRAGRFGPADTASCWPCPTDPNMTGNWAVLSGFQTGSYGPLYRMQDPGAATGVWAEPGAELSPFVNALSQNRPNPFNPETAIPYVLARPGRVTIRVYTVGGRCVRTLVNASRAAGPHVTYWDGRLDSGARAASGIYFYRITFPDGGASARKMTILR